MKIIVTNKETGNKTEYNNATAIIDNPFGFQIECGDITSRHHLYSLYDWEVIKEEPLPTLSDVVNYIDGLIKEAEISKSDTVDDVEVKYLKILADNVIH